jgi:predicted nucleic acid-binding protein
MILLDTNVLSEPMKPLPDLNVLAWLDAQQIETLYISSTVLAEMLEGVERMPQGKRRDAVASVVDRILQTLIGERVLAYDRAAAEYYAAQVVRATVAGKDVKLADGQIAAVAAVHGLSVATRDVTPFLAMGVDVIDPWSTRT